MATKIPSGNQPDGIFYHISLKNQQDLILRSQQLLWNVIGSKFLSIDIQGGKTRLFPTRIFHTDM